LERRLNGEDACWHGAARLQTYFVSIGYANVAAEHQVAALPPAEKQEKNRDQGQRQPIGNDRRRALLRLSKARSAWR
jgi:hypothetical protein